jgi:serine/threonine-protein kinase
VDGTAFIERHLNGCGGCCYDAAGTMTGPSTKRHATEGTAPSSDWTAAETPSAVQGSGEGGGFTPGTMLAGRFRVVALLGRGGMGEVYRADDVKLGQPVALKFVRGALSPELRDRLYAEVALGRQVAHPSVCRLYDVVEVDGQTFLAMEYVDGEDLASLLARIGRLPGDKALDILRDLGAGLAAVHEKGIVHRDLKPANVMIDGRGRARLTDFGLAVALESPGHRPFAGTPAYMSPEQLAGEEVTVRSDLYALGLIAYEMVTGQRFYEARTVEELTSQHREAKGAKLTSVSRMAHPAVERMIHQCVQEDAAARPSSARAVLAALPATDPLEAAVAAGETPSPEAVAAAAKVGDLSPGAAWAALGTALGGLVLAAWLCDQAGTLRPSVLPKPPEVLVQRARDVLARLGHAEGALDAVWSFEWDQAYLDYVAGARAPVPSDDVTALHFFYRQSPRKLIAANRDGMVLRNDPPADMSGMAEVVLDPRGRLTSFQAVPPQMEAPREAWPEPDWSPLFQEAGLDPSAFRPAASRWAAPVDTDRKAAWEGAWPGAPAVPLRIEAAAYHGRPVWFAVLPPWDGPSRMSGGPPSSATPVSQVSVLVLALAMPLGGFLLARRNLRLGRGDRKGALRVALFVFASYGLARMFRADHVSDPGDELWIMIKVLAYPALWAMQMWLLYVALEPYARRRLPHVLISWKRLLSGRLRDPLVGRDLLLGVAAGVLMLLVYVGSVLASAHLGLVSNRSTFIHGATLAHLKQVGFRLFVNQFSAVLYAMTFLFMLVLLRLLVRAQWAAAVLWCLLVAGPLVGEHPLAGWVAGVARAGFMLVALTQGGLLVLATTLFVMFVGAEVPLTLDVTAWYASRGWAVVVAIAGLAVYGFHVSLGGKPVFGGSLLED